MIANSTKPAKCDQHSAQDASELDVEVGIPQSQGCGPVLYIAGTSEVSACNQPSTNDPSKSDVEVNTPQSQGCGPVLYIAGASKVFSKTREINTRCHDDDDNHDVNDEEKEEEDDNDIVENIRPSIGDKSPRYR